MIEFLEPPKPNPEHVKWRDEAARLEREMLSSFGVPASVLEQSTNHSYTAIMAMRGHP